MYIDQSETKTYLIWYLVKNIRPCQSVSDVSVIPGISDYDAVLFSLNIEGIINYNPRHYIWKADLDGVSSYMKHFLDTLTSTDPHKSLVEQNWLVFKGAIHEALEKYISKPQIKT